MIALFAAGCGGPESTGPESSPATSMEPEEPSVQMATDRQSEAGASTYPDTETEPDPANTGEHLGSAEAGQDNPGDSVGSAEIAEVPSPEDELAQLVAELEAGDEPDNAPASPIEGVDSYLGGAPDAYTTTALADGLEAAGVDLTGITLTVLPITEVEASLLVLEIGDEYLASGYPSEAEGEALTTAFLTLPEMETAGIAQLVTLYRGTDEEGGFTLTFAISIDALRNAQATGADLGESLVVQVDRGL